MKKKRSKTLPAVLLAVVLAGGAWYAFGASSLGNDEVEMIDGAEAQRGPLRISVVERGNLTAADSVTLKSEIEGSTTILYLIEEGTMVQPGDLLCELDTSSLVDRRVQQEIKVQNALASYTKAKQNHQIQISQNESDNAEAERDVIFAESDLAKYLEGDMPQEQKKSDEDILLREEELKRAEDDYRWSKTLAEKGFLEATELESDRLAMTRAQVALDQALRAKVLLETFEIPRQKMELEAAVTEKKREKVRVALQATARLADYEADLKTSKAKYDLESSEFEKLVEQIDKAIIKAPVAGMVVYAIEERGRYGGGEPMSEGREVRERQEIITIPSEKGYVAEASLHESVLEKVQIGMPCLVTVDALQETLRGQVTFKAVLPDQQSWWANPDLRVYRTLIEVLDNEPRVRPGMSCSIEILVDEIPDTLYIPVQAIYLDAGAPIALVSTPDGPQKRSIEVGQNNGKWAEVLSGLTESETVLLSLPAGFRLEPASDTQEPEDTKNWPASKQSTGERGVAQAKPKADGVGSSAQAGGQRGRMDPAAMERWRKENPEQAKAMEEAMKDPEKRKAMLERFKKEGGGGSPAGTE